MWRRRDTPLCADVHVCMRDALTVGVHDNHGCLVWLTQDDPLAGVRESNTVCLHTSQGNAVVSDGERYVLHCVPAREEGDGARDDPDREIGLGTRGCSHRDDDWYCRSAGLLNDNVACGVCGVIVVRWAVKGHCHGYGMGRRRGEPME